MIGKIMDCFFLQICLPLNFEHLHFLCKWVLLLSMNLFHHFPLPMCPPLSCLLQLHALLNLNLKCVFAGLLLDCPFVIQVCLNLAFLPLATHHLFKFPPTPPLPPIANTSFSDPCSIATGAGHEIPRCGVHNLASNELCSYQTES